MAVSDGRLVVCGQIQELTTTVVGMETPAAVCHEDAESQFSVQFGG